MLNLFLRKSENFWCEKETLILVLLAIKEEYLLKTFEIQIGLEVEAASTYILLGDTYKKTSY